MGKYHPVPLMIKKQFTVLFEKGSNRAISNLPISLHDLTKVTKVKIEDRIVKLLAQRILIK